VQTYLLALRMALRERFVSEDGQDLVEYALVLALIALGATAGMNTLAGDLSSAFSSVGNMITTDIG